MTILLLNGPNLNLLGRRKPEIYGSRTLSDVEKEIRALAEPYGIEIVTAQSNHEGVLIDWLQESVGQFIGVILNAGGLTHTSVALRDAVDFATQMGVPVVEVHISNIHTRETFRHVSLLTGVCAKSVMGIGTGCYAEALKFLIDKFNQEKSS